VLIEAFSQFQRPTRTSRNHKEESLTEFFICFISVRVHFREPKIFAFSAKISLERGYAGFSGKLKTGALRAAFNKKFPNG
jgi:hypothetical protein